MAVDDFLDATGAAVPLDPGLQELARLLGPPCCSWRRQ